MNYRNPFILDVLCQLPALLFSGVVAWLIVELTGSSFLAGCVWMQLWLRTMEWFMARSFAVLASRWPTVPDPADPWPEYLRDQTRG